MVEYVGLRWYKCDFHLHTMNSECYRDREKDSVEDWVKVARDKGLECVAITDHNDFRGIDEIKKQCHKNGIIAFPGVELSCDSSKVHLLIIFDVNENGEKVQTFLNQVGIFGDLLGKSGNTCRGDIFEVCAKAKQMGALVVAAHIDEFNGICEISYDNIKKLLCRDYLEAVQVVNGHIWKEYEENNNLSETSTRLSGKYGKNITEEKAKEWYKAYRLAKESGLPMLMFSDNPCEENNPKHGLWGIGDKYTWLKMNQAPDLESVRQALLSYDMRVRNCDESKEKPDVSPELWIKSLKFSHTNINKKNDVVVNFNPQLNTIIGGRGSGKSAIIRIIAGGMESFEGEGLDSILNEQENFYKERKRDKKGIFDSESCVEIIFERTGEIYKLDIRNIKNMKSQVRKLYKYVDNDWNEINDGNYFDFFKAQIYTQKQIYEIALDSSSLLSIVDQDIEGLSQKIADKDTTLEKLISKHLEINALNNSINSEGKIITELKDIEEQISKFEKSGIALSLKEKQKYDMQRKSIDDYIEKKNQQIQILNESIENMLNENLVNADFEDQEIDALIRKDEELYKDRKKSIVDTIASMNNDTVLLKQSIELSGWSKNKNSAELHYKETLDSLQKEGINYNKLDELLEKKNIKLLELDKVKNDKVILEKVLVEKNELYGAYEKKLKEISALRANFIDEVIGKDTNVKFEIKRNRSRSSFVNMMKTVIKKDNATIDDDINKLADVFFGKDGVNKFRKIMWDINNDVDVRGYSSRTKKAILETQPESFARMISFLPEDELRVSYKPENSKKYIPLSSASAGQKTTAILTFLLAHGDVPLLLDQPEDDLDNKLVYDLIVRRLKKTKSKRQIIVVTHNANIPVNADAEYIISMNSEIEEVDTKFEGTMDDENIRKEICDVMEGTQYAFEMRAKKYHFNITE